MPEPKPRNTRARTVPIAMPQRRLSDAQRLAWLHLIRTENVGPVTFRELINSFGGAAFALKQLPGLSRRGGRSRPIKVCSVGDAEKELRSAEKAGAQLVALGEPGYPPALAAIQAPPPLLYVKGCLEHLERPIIAIVGARNGSAVGQKMTGMLASDLGQQGFVVASGLARGIDRAAHMAALEYGTAAVVAGGVNVVYPPEHEDLQAEIASRGCLISERPPNFKPRGQDFPRRNRIIAGMALGTIVVEAATRSGSLITARFASEFGRDVFAVPGHPLDPRAAGTNRLLKQGATIITHAEDAATQLAPLLAPSGDLFSGWIERNAPADTAIDETDVEPHLPAPTTSDRTRTIAALGPTPIGIDEFSRLVEIEIPALQVILLELDLAGKLLRHPGQQVSLRYPS